MDADSWNSWKSRVFIPRYKLGNSCACRVDFTGKHNIVWSNRFRIKNIKKSSSTVTENEWLNSIHLSFSFAKGYLIMEIENFFPCFYWVYGNTWGSLRKTRNCVETRFPRNFFICRKLLLVFLTLYGAFLTGNKQFRDSSLVYIPYQTNLNLAWNSRRKLS